MRRSFLLIFLILSAFSSAECSNDLISGFFSADSTAKNSIVDSLMASDTIPASFFNDLLNTNKYQKAFATFENYWNFQLKAADKLANHGNPATLDILKRYYYGGHKSRPLNRPANYQLKFHWQKELASVTDSKGVIWAVTEIWWYGRRNDLWLIHKNPDDTLWSSPLFTGEFLPYYNGSRACSLAIDGKNLRLLIPWKNKDISPKRLTKDSDKDGLYDVEEERFTTDPRNSDTDHDGLKDGEDLNPLARAPDIGTLTDADMIKMTAFRTVSGDEYPFNLYTVIADSGKPLEFLPYTPNCLILTMDSTRMSNFAKPMGGTMARDVDLELYISLNYAFTDSMEVFTSRGSTGAAREVEFKNGLWFLGKVKRHVIY